MPRFALALVSDPPNGCYCEHPRVSSAVMMVTMNYRRGAILYHSDFQDGHG
jgi:hypothetical protein